MRKTVLAAIVRDTPKAFWETVLALTRQTYKDVFNQIQNDPGVLDEQRIDALYQARHFRMEQVLVRVAREHGLSASMNLITQNGRAVGYIAKGAVGMTQAYVTAIGEMPKPAKFRDKFAAMNQLGRGGRLPFGDESETLLQSKDFYGIVAHNPVGRRFEEGLQTLGMVQLCIPEPGCASWLAQFPLQEIAAAYPVAPESEERGNLRWRSDDAGKEQQGE